MTVILRSIAACLALLSLLALPAPAHAGKERAALQHVERMLDDVQHTLDTRGPAYLPEAIKPYFHWDLWTRVLLKPRKDQLSKQHVRKIRQLLPGYIAYLYHDRFAGKMRARPRVIETRSIRRDIGVVTEFQMTNGKTMSIRWRIRWHKGNGPGNADFIYGGVSFMLLTRDEFTAVIDRGGPEALIDYLHRKSL